MDLLEAITSPENLFWAWEKAKHSFANESAWFDDLELIEFEGTLHLQLESLRDEMRGGSYRCAPLRPLPHPKGADRESLELRQSFSVAVRDQVAWLAVVNVLGPSLDDRMPSWSLGNRLYRPVWTEEEELETEPTTKWKFGPYRHTSRRLYRKFRHSWPLYRRYVFLTLKTMSRATARALPSDKFEERLVKSEQVAPLHRRLPYLVPGYWQDDMSDVYWAGLDFEKFYPTVNLEIVAQSLLSAAPQELVSASLEKLIHRLLRFHLDITDWSKEELGNVGLRGGARTFHGLPTGLMVSGFLANVAMMEIDAVVESEAPTRQIAHFRYVDDHIILGRSLEQIVDWITRYTEILKASKIGARFNLAKFEPEELGAYLQGASKSGTRRQRNVHKLAERARESCRLDPLYPSPLMTATLNKISQLSDLEFELMDDQEKVAFLSELEHLMLADINEKELQISTRLSFVATLLTRLVPEWTPDNDELTETRIALQRCRDEMSRLTRELQSVRLEAPEFAERQRELERKNELEAALDVKLRIGEAEFEEAQRNHRAHYGALVRRALHQHPAKLRLWQRLLEYGYTTGYPVCDLVAEELVQVRSANVLFGKYVSAFVMRTLAKLVVRAAKELTQGDIPDERHARLEKFVDDVWRSWRPLLIDEKVRWFERKSAFLLLCALGTEEMLTQGVRREPRPLGEANASAEKGVDRPINWRQSPRVWASQTGVDLSVWVWWIERSLHRIGETSPTEKWGEILESLDTADSLSWSMWSRYPTRLPKKAMQAILSGEHVLQREEQGWLQDALAGVALELPPSTVRLPPSVATTVRAMEHRRSKSSVRTLADWIHWTANSGRDVSADPRMAEWTALEIVKQIALRLQLPEDSSNFALLHPANIVVPASWFDTERLESGLKAITWESWRRAVESDQLQFQRKKYLIADGRLTPRWWSSEWGGDDWAHLHGLGMLLLSLLRKSYEFPAEWNPLGQQRAWSSAIRPWISRVNSSSWTTAILESCLLPRARETFLLEVIGKQFALQWDDDSRQDPPIISNLDVLIKLLTKAQRALELGQLSMPRHKPRQLVPIALHPLSSELWGEVGDLL